MNDGADSSQLLTVQMTEEEYLAACDNMDGVCLACGEMQDGGCEPDARNYPCYACEATEVYGVEWALVMGNVEIID